MPDKWGRKRSIIIIDLNQKLSKQVISVGMWLQEGC